MKEDEEMTPNPRCDEEKIPPIVKGEEMTLQIAKGEEAPPPIANDEVTIPLISEDEETKRGKTLILLTEKRRKTDPPTMKGALIKADIATLSLAVAAVKRIAAIGVIEQTSRHTQGPRKNRTNTSLGVGPRADKTLPTVTIESTRKSRKRTKRDDRDQGKVRFVHLTKDVFDQLNQ